MVPIPWLVIKPLASPSPGWKVADDVSHIVIETGGPNLKAAHTVCFDRKDFHSPILAWRMEENL
jgi:hypothetical protein